MNIFELLSCCFKTYCPLLTLCTILSTSIAFHYATHYCTKWNPNVCITYDSWATSTWSDPMCVPLAYNLLQQAKTFTGLWTVMTPVSSTCISSTETVYGSPGASQLKSKNSSVSPYHCVDSWQSYLQSVSTLLSVAFDSSCGRCCCGVVTESILDSSKWVIKVKISSTSLVKRSLPLCLDVCDDDTQRCTFVFAVSPDLDWDDVLDVGTVNTMALDSVVTSSYSCPSFMSSCDANKLLTDALISSQQPTLIPSSSLTFYQVVALNSPNGADEPLRTYSTNHHSHPHVL